MRDVRDNPVDTGGGDDTVTLASKATRQRIKTGAGDDRITIREPAKTDNRLLKAGLGFKQAKQTVVDAFEIAYLGALMIRNDGNITRSAQEAGLTRYHLRELLKRHGLKGGDAE